MASLYEELNKAWKATCRILLKGEIGELKYYDGWLKEFLPAFGKRKSSCSGKDVILAKCDYCDNANVISLDEAREKAAPLSINDIKDVDTILEAIAESWEYTGNKSLGNSRFIEASDNIIDSQYVYGSANVRQSAYVYSSYFVNENSKYVFGSNWVSNSEFVIKGESCNSKRLFNSSWNVACSDMYFCFYSNGCSELIFCFNQRNKRNAIGNLALPKDKYWALKKKLLEEIKGELQKNKTFPSIFQLVPNKAPPKDIAVSAPPSAEDGDFSLIERAFSSTFRILFKKDPDKLAGYENWLNKHLLQIPEVTSPFGSPTYLSDLTRDVRMYPDKRMVTQNEAVELAKLQLNENQLESISDISEGLDRIGYFLGTATEQATNCFENPIAFYSSNVYKVGDGVFSENCAVDGSINYSKYLFGSDRVVSSEFCINCYNSLNLRRCFELDACTNCADSYFCHNCEGLQDAMFCFNAKGKRHAIGNNGLPPEQYRQVKGVLVDQMAEEILKNKNLQLDIFNIGCRE
jgi:hypothetical protein